MESQVSPSSPDLTGNWRENVRLALLFLWAVVLI